MRLDDEVPMLRGVEVMGSLDYGVCGWRAPMSRDIQVMGIRITVCRDDGRPMTRRVQGMRCLDYSVSG